MFEKILFVLLVGVSGTIGGEMSSKDSASVVVLFVKACDGGDTSVMLSDSMLGSSPFSSSLLSDVTSVIRSSLSLLLLPLVLSVILVSVEDLLSLSFSICCIVCSVSSFSVYCSSISFGIVCTISVLERGSRLQGLMTVSEKLRSMKFMERSFPGEYSSSTSSMYPSLRGVEGVSMEGSCSPSSANSKCSSAFEKTIGSGLVRPHTCDATAAMFFASCINLGPLKVRGFLLRFLSSFSKAQSSNAPSAAQSDSSVSVRARVVASRPDSDDSDSAARTVGPVAVAVPEPFSLFSLTIIRLSSWINSPPSSCTSTLGTDLGAVSVWEESSDKESDSNSGFFFSSEIGSDFSEMYPLSIDESALVSKSTGASVMRFLIISGMGGFLSSATRQLMVG